MDRGGGLGHFYGRAAAPHSSIARCSESVAHAASGLLRPRDGRTCEPDRRAGDCGLDAGSQTAVRGGPDCVCLAQTQGSCKDEHVISTRNPNKMLPYSAVEIRNPKAETRRKAEVR